ncbi:MAG TPA: glutathione S-transferase family protein [Terriglobales bacterium]|nr:glutathione S-transferase family protein [Terriglobales bacterium]
MSELTKQLFRFYGAEVSYFTGKVRPALRYKHVPYAEILATPAVYREVIRPRTGLAFIPIVVTPDDETWQDTSDILDRLEQRFAQPPLYPATPVQRLVAYLWELYADEFLVLPALHYRWSYPESEAKARADFAATNGDPEQANRFADRMKGVLAFVGINEQTAPAVEAHLAELLARLEAHFAEHPFLLGAAPSLADCAMIGPLYAHLYLDAVPGRLLRERAPRVCHWIERMNHPDPDARGSWLVDDGIAETMRPLLNLIGVDAVPVILDNVRDFEAWADTRPADVAEPPRGTGSHTTSLRGVAMQRFTSAYSLWMLQRPLDEYCRLNDADRARVDQHLAGSGCDELLRYRPRHRLGKDNFRLVFEPHR